MRNVAMLVCGMLCLLCGTSAVLAADGDVNVLTTLSAGVAWVEPFDKDVDGEFMARAGVKPFPNVAPESLTKAGDYVLEGISRLNFDLLWPLTQNAEPDESGTELDVGASLDVFSPAAMLVFGLNYTDGGPGWHVSGSTILGAPASALALAGTDAPRWEYSLGPGGGMARYTMSF